MSNDVGKDRNSVRPIRVIRAISGSDYGCGCLYATSKIWRSIRFVCVGPVTMRSPVAFRKLKESLRCRYFDGISPRSTAREHVAGSTRPPAAAVGPSVPSVATLAKHDGRFGGRDAIEMAQASAIS